MALKEPQSMDECVYFTNRVLNNNGKIRAWVFRELCPKCKKSMMCKPKDPKTGRPKIRATEFICPSCNHAIPCQEYEDSLTISIQYTCPKCKTQGELQLPYKRKKMKRFNEEDQKDETVDAIKFECSKCKQPMYITKKMK
jgi:predicted RNA-binding Zn-ribbon protein involved in translation (DUF1610 family)